MPVPKTDRVTEIQQLVRSMSGLVATALTAIPSIVASVIYAAGDAVGGQLSFTTDVAGRALPKRGVVVGAKVVDTSKVAMALTLHAFSAAITPTADNAALALSAADALNWVTSIQFAVAVSLGGGNVSEVADHDSPYYSPTGALYAQAQTQGTPTVASGGVVQVQLFIAPFTEGIPV